MSPTPPGPALTAPGQSSGPMAPSATPMPLGVLALGEVRAPYPGEEPLGGWQTPNGIDINGNEIVVPADKASKYGPSVWMETTPGNYKRIASQQVWDITDQNGRYALMGAADTGGTVQGSWLAQGPAQMPTQEEFDAVYSTLRASTADLGWSDDDLRKITASRLFGDGSYFEQFLQGQGSGAMTAYQAAGMDLDTRKFEFQQKQYQDELAYQQQALVQQAQQAAAAAAAQRRAQAMSLAESILGMQQQQWAQVSGWALPAGSQTAPGWEQGGAVSQMFANQGLPYTPIQAVQTPGVDYAPAYAWAQKLLGGS